MNEVTITCKNPNKSTEGTDSIILDIIKSLSEIRDNNQIITNVDITINTIDDPKCYTFIMNL